MDYIKKADISFYGIDDELKNNSSSIFSTNINFSKDYLTYESKTYTDNQNNIQTSNISTSIYNYDSYAYTEPSTSNVSFANGEINYTSYDSSKFANITTLFKNNPPWGVYLAEDWRGTTLFDISGNNRHATTTGTITKTTASGNGATAPITYITGGPSETITWTAGSIPTSFTILSLTRYAGGNTQRILQASTDNWLHGHHTAKRGVCYYSDGWKTQNTNSIGNLFDWLTCIAKNDTRAAGFINNILIDGAPSGTATGGTGNFILTINNVSARPTEDSDFAFGCVMIWDKHLADSDMVLLNTLINDYKAGIVNPRLFFPVYDYNYPILKTIEGIPINPLVWYKFDGSATQMLLDSGTSGNNLTNNGATYDTTNLIRGNGSASFIKENNQYLSMPTTLNLNEINTTSGISFSFWLRATNYENYSGIICIGNFNPSNNQGTKYLHITEYGGTNRTVFQLSNGTNNNEFAIPASIFTFTSSLWSHFVWTISTTGTWNIYFNGIAILTNSIQRVIPVFEATNRRYWIGKNLFSDLRRNFNGNMDDFRIYDRVLTQEQVSELYYGKYIDKSYPIIKRNNVVLNPLVWYKFDTSSDLGKDEMGNHNLTNFGSTGYNATDLIKGIGSASFNGTNQYLQKINAFNLNLKDFTISFWIKRTANNKEEWLVDIGSANATRQRIIIGHISTNVIRYSFYGDDLDTPVYSSDVGKWVHFTFTYKTGAKTKKIFRNGVEVASGTAGGEINTTNRFIIGVSSGYYYGGLMDDFRVYEYELTATEVRELYTGRVEVITTKTDKTLYSNNNPYIWNDRTIDNVSYLLEAVPSTFTKRNSKKFKFTLNSSIKQLKLSSKAKLVIESVVIPNVLSQSFLQSKAINNVILKMKGILNHNNFDSSTKGSGNSVIFSVPIKLNSQGASTTYQANQPDFLDIDKKTRLNTETGFLFINPEPDVLYNFDINQNFIDDGEIEFTLVYDIGSVWKLQDTNVFLNQQTTLDFETDKRFLEAFNINFIIKDFDDGDNLVYSEKGLLNTINRNIF